MGVDNRVVMKFLRTSSVNPGRKASQALDDLSIGAYISFQICASQFAIRKWRLVDCL
jgi:hypothetical protein